MSGPLLTVRDVAERYGVETKTVYGWIRDGRLPCLTLPAKRAMYRIRPDHLEEFERRRELNAAPVPRILPSRHPEPLEPIPEPPRDAFARGQHDAQRRAPERPLLGGAS